MSGSNPFAVFIHPQTLAGIAVYPVNFYLASRFLAYLGIKNPLTEANFLTGQVLRGLGGLACALVGLDVVLRHPEYYLNPLENHHKEPQLDFMSRFQFVGFLTADLASLLYAYYAGYEKVFKWDLYLHHLAVVLPALNFEPARSEGAMSCVFMADFIAPTTFLVLLSKQLVKSGVISDDKGSKLRLVARIARLLVLLLYRIPFCWLYAVYKIARRKIDFPEKIDNSVVAGLTFTALLMLFVDVYWATKMPGPIYWGLKKHGFFGLSKKVAN